MINVMMTVLLIIVTKLFYYVFVKAVFKKDNNKAVIKQTALIVAPSFLIEIAAFVLNASLNQLVIVLVAQIQVIYIVTSILKRTYSKKEILVRIIALFFPFCILQYMNFRFVDNKLTLVLYLYYTFGFIISLILYNYIFCTFSEFEQELEMDTKMRQLEAIKEQKTKSDEGSRYYKEFLNSYHEKLINIENSEDRILAMNNSFDEINHELDNLRPKRYCVNLIVNTILNQTYKRCEESGIDIEIDVNIPELINVNDVDLCSIFNNLINNAIKANEYVKDNKKIVINCNITKNYLNINVLNTFEPKRKKEKRRGYGMEILKDIAKKYDGSFKTLINNNEFEAVFIAKVIGEL